MAEDLNTLEAKISELIEEGDSSQTLIKLDTNLELTKNKHLASAYLAGYELGYNDAKNGLPRDPVKEEESMIVEPMRISLPWWP